MAVALDEMNKLLNTYWDRLDGSQKEGVIEYIKYLLEEKHSISLTQYNLELEEGRTAIKLGQFVTQEELEKEALSW